MHSADEKKLRLLWLRFLREIDEKTTTVSKELLAIPEIAQAIELAEQSAYSPGELEVYDSYWDSVRREKTLMLDKFDEGKAVGEAIGEARGEARGEAKKARTMAVAMLKSNKPVDEISLFTGLSLEAIARLKDRL